MGRNPPPTVGSASRLPPHFVTDKRCLPSAIAADNKPQFILNHVGMVLYGVVRGLV